MVPTDSILKKLQFLFKIQWLPDMPLLFPGESFLQWVRERCPVKKDARTIEKPFRYRLGLHFSWLTFGALWGSHGLYSWFRSWEDTFPLI